MPPPVRRCSDCRYFEPIPSHILDVPCGVPGCPYGGTTSKCNVAGDGVCHCYPPTAVHDLAAGLVFSHYPITRVLNWCGEWRAV